jgi:hypothetical protein
MSRAGACFLLLALLPPCGMAQPQQTAEPAGTVAIVLGESVAALNGPWRFHSGDDPRWADPSFDDSAWPTLDLSAPAGAHDSDVGLSGYVPGWGKRGYAGYSGYAWYRMRIAVSGAAGRSLGVTGPPLVDDAYQLFFNGTLLGSDGDFAGATPVVYSIQPRLFALPQAASGVLAFRVWMSSGTLREAADVGGIRIAPAIGEINAAGARYRLQWWQTVCGYLLDAIEPMLFLLLAVVAWVLIAFDPANAAYPRLIGALLLTALVRANQALYFWTQCESIHVFDVAKNVLLLPLGLGCWLLAWHAWFRLDERRWFWRGTVALTLSLMAAQLLSRSWVLPQAAGHPFLAVSAVLRALFVPALGYVQWRGIRQHGREGWLALPALSVLATGLFAPELSMLRVPGIWFPFGVGVSRTQYAYALFGVLMLWLLLRRLLGFAQTKR